MSWDAWALLSILALCGTVIAWSCWGFHRDRDPQEPHSYRLALSGGGHLYIPRPIDHPIARHRMARSV
ncbi:MULTISPECIES: hypothetical protein [unclassified Nocardia]|uniref:hypothetical protein n=1 Tax=unclassified Nocardia TaxID=2637762 RepID=UPI0035D6087F